jgi:hypothetical protein
MMEYINKGIEDIYLVYSHEYHEEYSHTKEIRDKLELETLKKGLHINIEVGSFKEIVKHGKVIRFIHGNGGSGPNRTSKLESDLKQNKIRAADGDVPRVDYIFSAHTHRIGTAGYGKSISHTIPCYKLLDTKGEQMNLDMWHPDIGLTIVTFECRFGEVRINIDDITTTVPFRLEEVLKEYNKWNIREKNGEGFLTSKIPKYEGNANFIKEAFKPTEQRTSEIRYGKKTMEMK